MNECIFFEEMKPLQNNVANTDMVSYAKLIGAIEIKCKNIFKVNSFMIKNFKDKIRNNKKELMDSYLKLVVLGVDFGTPNALMSMK